MERILIDVSKVELDFIREALEIKHINLMSYFDECEENTTPKPSLKEVSRIAEDLFREELEKNQFKRTKKASYGLKKDGTPKAKPGRKV
jgi:hypothetical protein